jgi:hypothetical protein
MCLDFIQDQLKSLVVYVVDLLIVLFSENVVVGKGKIVFADEVESCVNLG